MNNAIGNKQITEALRSEIKNRIHTSDLSAFIVDVVVSYLHATNAFLISFRNFYCF